MTDASVSQTIPVVSLRDFTSGTRAQREAFISKVGDALVEVGFFALEDHGVDDELVQRSYDRAAAFFEQDGDKKARCIVPGIGGQRGFTKLGDEHARDTDAPDLKEFFHVGRDVAADHRLHKMYGPNVWPDDVSAFAATMRELYGALDNLAGLLLEAISTYIGEDPAMLGGLADGGDTILRLIHYPPVPADASPASVRAAAHEDINFITILCEATAGGLQLQQRDGSWLPVHALKGQFIVDSGDMIQHLTNGMLRSTTHRVVNPDDSRERRFSMPFFVHPNPSADLTPRHLPVVLTGGVVRYESITAAQFLGRRLRELGLHVIDANEPT